MVQLMNQCKCGNDEFITKPNSYDIYQIIEGNLEYQRCQLIEDELILYCRNCGKPYKESQGPTTNNSSKPTQKWKS